MRNTILRHEDREIQRRRDTGTGRPLRGIRENQEIPMKIRKKCAGVADSAPPIKTVTVNCRDWKEFNADKETITLKGPTCRVNVLAVY